MTIQFISRLIMKQFSFAALLVLVTSEILIAGPLILNDEAPIVPKLDTRIRYEHGELEGREASHNASIRNRLGLLTKEINGFQFFAEYEGTIVADRNDYFALVHGDPTKTVIADPESHELNQLWLSYKTTGGAAVVKVGRQAFVLDNQRYVGGVAWRQNMQTFDAATLKWTPNSDLEVTYAYIHKVNRIFGSNALENGVPGGVSDFEGDSHLVNAKLKSFPLGTLTGYVYSLDLETERGGLTANSSNSFGFHLSGDLCDTSATYYLEYGHQTEAYDSPLDYAVNYGHAYVTVPVHEKVKLTGGWEYLGADNGVGYRFPLGTLHKFNGFADQFLNTPATGLTDTYVTLSAKLPCDWGAAVTYHHFEDADYDVEWGDEIDVVVTKKLGDRALVLGKGAFFMGNNTGFNDLNRFSVEVNYKY